GDVLSDSVYAQCFSGYGERAIGTTDGCVTNCKIVASNKRRASAAKRQIIRQGERSASRVIKRPVASGRQRARTKPPTAPDVEQTGRAKVRRTAVRVGTS